MLRKLGAPFVLLALLAGCMAPEPASTPAFDATEERSAQVVAQAGAGPTTSGEAPAAQPHGTPKRVDGAVEVTQDAQGMWHAKLPVTITNGVAGFGAASIRQDVYRGELRLTGAPAGGYTMDVVLEGVGLTEQMARDTLASLTLIHSDTAADGRLDLATTVEATPLVSQQLPGGTVQIGRPAEQWSATIVTTLPAHLAYDVAADVYSGAVSATNLAGPAFVLESYSGTVTAERLAAESLVLDAYSGAVSVTASTSRSLVVDTYSGSATIQGAYDDLTADTYSGAISADVAPAASGGYLFDAYSGAIDVRLSQENGQAFDILAESYSGSVDVDVEGAQRVESDDDVHHVVSAGYEAAAIQTQVVLETYSGAITVKG